MDGTEFTLQMGINTAALRVESALPPFLERDRFIRASLKIGKGASANFALSRDSNLGIARAITADGTNLDGTIVYEST
jgi:hypothetical protein